MELPGLGQAAVLFFGVQETAGKVKKAGIRSIVSGTDRKPCFHQSQMSHGDNAGADIVSRSVAAQSSQQELYLRIDGNGKCHGHSECDAIIMDNAKISAVPELEANHPDAALIHEAAIGKIAGEQIVKLMTLGLTEEEAEEKIVEGFLR